jgi:tetratricopeptide (TPR) repeat protein
MIKSEVDSNFSKSKGLVILEYIILGLCLCVIALRATIIEGLNTQASGRINTFTDNIYSLSVSVTLIISFLCWIIISCNQKRLLYKNTGIEIGLVLFVIAATVAAAAAANKRAAFSNYITLLAPILMSVMLVQILNTNSKIKLLLFVIAALGVSNAVQCATQLFSGNEQLIKFYEQDANSVLAQQNITPNTLEHWLFEHRLYSKGISGFFITSNSAGAFMILASFAALALALERFKTYKTQNRGLNPLIATAIIAVLVILGLLITRSKGAIAGAVIAAAMFTVYLLFRYSLEKYKKTILVVCILLILAGGTAVVWYGLTYNTLPGGNSMFVRWQYWAASVKMYADNPLKGVGPGNFAYYYLRYKPPAGIETVTDPHNFLLSILTQYGPAGLIGFLAAIFVPLFKTIFHRNTEATEQTSQAELSFKPMAIIYVTVITVALLLLRPLLVRNKLGNQIGVAIYVITVLYIVPAAVFLGGFIALFLEDNIKKFHAAATVALFCAIVGILIHNLVDFAIFETGIYTTLWAMIACLIVLSGRNEPKVLKLNPVTRAIVSFAAVVLAWTILRYAFIPVLNATAKIQQSFREPDKACELLNAASQADIFDQAASKLNGNLCLDYYYQSGYKQDYLLEEAMKSFKQAITRNPADYKNYEKLGDIYKLIADTADANQKPEFLNKALSAITSAIENYPGSAELRIKSAKIAELLGKTRTAVAEYQKAIDIEEQYKRQFQKMYPGKTIFSRLNQADYNFAKQRIEQLSKQSTQ